MQKIKIIKGEEFKIAVREEITDDDIFINEYKHAAKMLDEIVGASVRGKTENGRKDQNWSWKQQDFENNIIAFCGERGEGKSSAMMTFVNAVYEMKENKSDEQKKASIFSPCHNLDRVHFAEPVLIDPSMFDDVHNVLDIVLAKIFKNFSMRYEQDNQYIDENKKERLLDQFQKVYRYLSLINNQEKMLDDEFDYEGNISKLSKLGESTNLKKELSELIENYLKAIGKDKENMQMIIAIDDLDLCSSNAYKMAEQIRKYLIIPNVVIVLSVKIDQLELCIMEKNTQDFMMLYRNKDDSIYHQMNKEIQIMAERYVAKLIPRQRRIYLPKVQNLDEIQIVYKEPGNTVESIIWNSDKNPNGNKPDKHKSFTLAMLELIYDRTGIRFLTEKSGMSYLLSNNLRDMVNWIAMLVDLEEPDGEDVIYYKNILAFKNYFEKQLTGDEPMLYEGLSLQDFGNMDTFHLHVVVRRILEKICSNHLQLNALASERQEGFYQVMELFDRCMQNIVDIEKETYIYRLRTVYTIRMNIFLREHRYHEMTDFMNGYIWGNNFSGLLPADKDSKLDRSRFRLETVDGFNTIVNKVNEKLNKLEKSVGRKGYKISYIARDENRNDYIKVWIVLGLLSNLFDYDSGSLQCISEKTMLTGNNQICDYIQISLENYLLGLCNLDMIFDIVNMEQLGIDRSEETDKGQGSERQGDFNKIIGKLKKENEESIRYAREIASNMDLALGIKDYCKRNRDFKGRTESEKERTKKLVEKFFENVERYMRQYGIDCDHKEFLEFSLGNDNKIEIAQLYAELFELSVENEPLRKQREADEKVAQYLSEFRRKLTETPKNWSDEKEPEYSLAIVTYFKKASVDKVKENLDNLASAVQQHNGMYPEKPLQSLDVEGLCSLYEYVVRMYVKNKGLLIAKTRHDEYKRLVKVKDEIQENMTAYIEENEQ